MVQMAFLEVEMTKPQRGGASVRERKAAELDALVKAELAQKRIADDAKITRLRALRLARDAELKSTLKTKRFAAPDETSG